MDIFKECSPEFLESIDKIPFAEVNFDISNIESHHPTTYFGVDLSMELDVEANEKAWEALEEAREAMWATPEYKALKEAVEAFYEARKAKEEAREAVEATPEWKDYLKAKEILCNGK